MRTTGRPGINVNMSSSEHVQTCTTVFQLGFESGRERVHQVGHSCIKGGAVLAESWKLFLPAYAINNFKSPKKEQTIY